MKKIFVASFDSDIRFIALPGVNLDGSMRKNVGSTSEEIRRLLLISG